MVQMQTRLKAADNVGVKEMMCIKVLGGSRKRFARVGDIIVVCIKDAAPKSKFKKGEVAKAVIVRTRGSILRSDGTVMRFSNNAAVFVKNNEPIGTRIFGPVCRELRHAYAKIVSLAPEVY